MNQADDYELWKVWWLAALYNMGAARRMEMVDRRRHNNLKRQEQFL